MSNIDLLRYPIGKFQPKESYQPEEIQQFIRELEAFPPKLEEATLKLTAPQLDTPYRDGGWTARQVIHHLADSHLNAYIRTKWTLTEDTPVIKAYEEKTWAETPETLLDPVISLNLLKALHHKWVAIVSRLAPGDFSRTFLHPETKKHVSLARQMATYAWHGEHHLAHINIIASK